MEKENRFRIKEVALNEDGTNIWFYPQFLTYKSSSTGMFWWRKYVLDKRWSNFFIVQTSCGMFNSNYTISRSDDEDYKKLGAVIAFREKSDAESVIKEFHKAMEEYSIKRNDEKNKEFGAVYDGEENKIHDVNI